MVITTTEYYIDDLDDDEDIEESEELEELDYDLMEGDDYDDLKDKYKGEIEPEGIDAIVDDFDYDLYSDSLRCDQCGFGLAWKDDGNAECWSCGAQYTRMDIFKMMDYKPPFKKCLRCKERYPHCMEQCSSVSKDELVKRGFEVDDF